MSVTLLAQGGAAAALHREVSGGSFADAPVTAVAGPWIHKYQASNVVLSLSRYAAPFPLPGSPPWAWEDYVDNSMHMPWALFAVGVVFAVVVPLVLHFCHPKVRSKTLGPPWFSLYAAGAAAVVCLVITAALGSEAQRTSFTTASAELRGAYEDVRTSQKLAEALRVSGSAVVNDLAELKQRCPSNVGQLLGASVDNIMSEIRSYIEEVDNGGRTMSELPQKIRMLQWRTKTVGDVVAVFLGLPIVLVVLCCGAIVTTMYVIQHASKRCAKRCETCEMPCLALGCVAPAMLVVSMVAAAELGVGILSSGYCLHADQVSMNYARHHFGKPSPAFDLTKYYLEGDGTNPALSHLSNAQVQIVDAIQWVRHYGDVTARSCPMWRKESSVILNLENVQYSMNSTAHLLSPYHIYPRYDNAVHDIVCKRLPENLAASAIVQMVLALVCLPALLCTASCVVDGLIEERSVHHGLARWTEDAVSV